MLWFQHEKQTSVEKTKKKKKGAESNNVLVDSVKTRSCCLFDSDKWLFDKLAALTDITVTKLWNTVNIS